MRKGIIAITGGSGHLGNVVVRKLATQGFKLKVLVFNTNHIYEHENIEKTHGDVRNIDDIRTLCQGCVGIIHMASHISIVSYEKAILESVNLEGTRNIIRVCKEQNIKLVYASSVEAIGKQGVHIHTEDDGFDEKTTLIQYGETKSKATQEVLHACTKGLNAVVICPSGIVGPFDPGTSKIGYMIKQFMKKKLPAYPQNGGFCFVDVRDVADAMIKAFEVGKSGTYYIVSSEYITTEYWMDILEEITGVKKPRVKIPLWVMFCVAWFIEPMSRLFKKTPIFTVGAVRVLRSNLIVQSKYITQGLHINTRPLYHTFIDQVKWYQGEEVSFF